MLWIEVTQSTPLFQGFNVQKGFEVKLLPLQFKPLSLFKEKWSPFGRFGIRKGIQKRDLSPTVLSPAPVFEQVDESSPIINEREENIAMSVTVISPELERFKPLSSNLIRIPLTETRNSPTDGLYTSVNRNPSVRNVPINTGQPVIEELFGELPPRPVGLIPELIAPTRQPVTPVPIQPITPVIIQPVQPISIQPVSPLYRQPVTARPIQPVSAVPIQPISPVFTQTVQPIPIQPGNPISTQPISSFPIQPVSPMPIQPVNRFPMLPISSFPVQPVTPVPVRQLGLIPVQARPSLPQGVIPIITPPPRFPLTSNTPLSEIPPTDGPLVRGSKRALYYGNVLLQLLSQFITNARLQISQLKASSNASAVGTTN